MVIHRAEDRWLVWLARTFVSSVFLGLFCDLLKWHIAAIVVTALGLGVLTLMIIGMVFGLRRTNHGNPPR